MLCNRVGAAAESLLLALALAKTGDEHLVFKTYASRNGRRETISLVTSSAPAYVRGAVRSPSWVS